MGNFTTNHRTIGPYQDRPFAAERPQDRSLQNPKTLDRLTPESRLELYRIRVLSIREYGYFAFFDSWKNTRIQT